MRNYGGIWKNILAFRAARDTIKAKRQLQMKGGAEMPGRSPTQLLDIHLVEERHIEESYFQDYAKVHERLEKMFEKGAKPMSPADADAAVSGLAAWLMGQAEKNVPQERLTQLYRSGLGHVCVELCAAADLAPEAIAARAYDEMKRRGWDTAVFDPVWAATEARRLGIGEKRGQTRKVGSSNAPGKTGVVKRIGTKEDRAMSNFEEPGKATVVPEQAEAAKKPEAEVKKPAAPRKKAAAAKPAAPKKIAEKKPALAKPAPKKPAAAKKLAEKKAAPAKKPAAKKAAAKPAVKKAAAKKPAVAKKTAVKKPAAKKVAAPRAAAAKKAAPAKKAAAKKTPAKSAAVRKVAVKKAAAKAPTARKAAPAKKAAVRKAATAKKPAARKAAPTRK